MPGTLHARHEATLTAVADMARAGETTAGWLQAERSDFVRFNRGRVRQCGTVERATVELRLIAAGRQARRTVVLTGESASDLRRLREAFDVLRQGLSEAPPDPHLCFSEAAAGSRVARSAPFASVDELTDAVCGAAGGADLVGFYAGGPLACGFASSLGHRHWHETPAWFFDHSVYATGDKAVKATLAGEAWDAGRLRAAVARTVASSRLLARPVRRLSPGAYRCYLSPRALADLIDMLGWGGFSARAQASGQSPLVRLTSGEARFDPRVQLRERLAAAGAPLFQADGFARPDETDLVRDGVRAQLLVSPRSAREFGLADNGASATEAPEALWMAGGDLEEAQALAALGRGLAVSNFWYLNFSDRQACRITGMTRFATMWVEDGEPVAPVEVMRFDDSLYRVLGPALEALTRDPVRTPHTDTYEGRSFGSTTAPGAIVRDLRFTL